MDKFICFLYGVVICAVFSLMIIFAASFFGVEGSGYGR